MTGQTALVNASSNPSTSRVFVYEIAGLKQNLENDKNNYQFRQSSNVFVKVPYNRISSFLQRINRSGGTIVSIQPLDAQ